MEMDATNSAQSAGDSCQKQSKHSKQSSSSSSSFSSSSSYFHTICHRSVSHSSSLSALHWATFVLLMLSTPTCESLKVVSLNVPGRVRQGSDLELVCLYDLGNATLYSLKWFFRTHEWERDGKEFFRYTPRATPHKQTFPLEGIQVDIEKSNGGTVYLRETRASGMYMCEISVEGTFQTVAAEKMMSVINSSSSLKGQQFELYTILFSMLSIVLSTLLQSNC